MGCNSEDHSGDVGFGVTSAAMHRFVLVCSLLLGACSGDAPKTTPDAAGPTDAAGPAAGSFGATCVTVSNMSTECTSGVCTNAFDMLGHPVCSVQCTPGMNASCPMGAAGQMCNMKGYCKP
jgi:hypothetical protein